MERLTPGEILVDVPGGRAWCNVAGDGPGLPLLLLHGGPGVPSHYLEPLRELSDERPVIFYDQLGCGRADRPDDPSLWTVERFAGELEAVRAALGLDRLHLFGHSWGTMLAVEHIVRGGTGVASLVLASPCMDVDLWVRDTRALLSLMPGEAREAIRRHEAAGTFESEEYQAANREFARRHISLSRPFPHPLMAAAMQNIGEQVYMTMAGPSEFTITGTLRNWSVAAQLPALEMPVLYTCGRYDEALPGTVQGFAEATPGARVTVFENSAHMTMLDEPDAYVACIREFLAVAEPAPGAN